MPHGEMLSNKWICPECGKPLCGDGFSTLEHKIEVHLKKHEEVKHEQRDREL